MLRRVSVACSRLLRATVRPICGAAFAPGLEQVKGHLMTEVVNGDRSPDLWLPSCVWVSKGSIQVQLMPADLVRGCFEPMRRRSSLGIIRLDRIRPNGVQPSKNSEPGPRPPESSSVAIAGDRSGAVETRAYGVHGRHPCSKSYTCFAENSELAPDVGQNGGSPATYRLRSLRS